MVRLSPLLALAWTTASALALAKPPEHLVALYSTRCEVDNKAKGLEPSIAAPVPPGPPAVLPATATEKERIAARVHWLVYRGTDAVLEDRWSDAEALFTEAARLDPSNYEILANVGHVQLTNGKPADAAQNLRAALRLLPASIDAKTRAKVRERFEVARSRVLAIRIFTNIEGAELRLDGRVVGISPMADATFALPGAHVVTAQRCGFVASAVSVDGGPGEAREPLINLDAVAPPRAATAAPCNGIPSQRTERRARELYYFTVDEGPR